MLADFLVKSERETASLGDNAFQFFVRKISQKSRENGYQGKFLFFKS
jgi:hypothetical protein